MKQGKIKLKLFFIFLIGALFMYYFFHYVPDKKLESEFRFTVVTVKDFEWPIDGDEIANYYYQINGKLYKGWFSLYDKGNREQFFKGQRFYIKYFPYDPDITTVIFNKLVPDTLKIIPRNGWEKLY